MATINGNELVYVSGVDGAGQASGSQFAVSLNQIAGLSGSNAFDSYKTVSNTSNSVISGSNLATTGWKKLFLALTGTLTVNSTLTTDTATNILNAYSGEVVGQSYVVRIQNKSSGAFSWTLAGGTGVSITGTASIAQGFWREYLVTLGSSTITFQDVGGGTN